MTEVDLAARCGEVPTRGTGLTPDTRGRDTGLGIRRPVGAGQGMVGAPNAPAPAPAAGGR